MNIDIKSKIFISGSFFLLIGLVLAIFLSFQVMQDTKTSVLPEESLPQTELEPTKQLSIYDLEIPFSSLGTVGEPVVSKPEEKVREEKKPGKGTVSKVKSPEQEEAELSAGLQGSPKDPGLSSGDISSLEATSSVSEDQSFETTETKVNQPNEEQIRDMQKKGIIIF